MKKQNLTKFALSIVCAAVLSACGGSSSSSTDTTTPSAAEVEAKKQADINNLVTRVTAANTANTLGLTEEQIKAFAAANYATTFADDALVEALKKFLADSTSSTSDINDQVDVSVPFTNFQIARNNKSNVGLAKVTDESSDTISFSRGTVEPHHSLDTIVVATPSKVGGQGKTAYLEDFQFNGTNLTMTIVAEAIDVYSKYEDALTVVEAKTTIAAAKTESKKQLKTLADAKKAADKALKAAPTDVQKKEEAAEATAAYELYKLADDFIQASKSTDDLAEVLEKAAAKVGGDTTDLTDAAKAIINEAGLIPEGGRDIGKITLSKIYKDVTDTKNTGEDRDPAKTEAETETKTQGTESGDAYVYQTGRRVYITADTDQQKAGMTYVAQSGTDNDVRVLKGTVAEVYGNKTFTYEVGQGTINEYDQANDGGVNLPLYALDDKKTGTYKGGVLKHVQYGRVTSKLHNVEVENLKAGVDANRTVVASYGSYGADGTENHYFARGTGHTTSAELSALGATGTLRYDGHAVSYGLNNAYDGRDTNAIPNAIGTSYKLHSGNHVVANIDLASKDVSGSIYNNWTNGKTDASGNLKLDSIELVKFTGKLTDNANITGTSALTYGDKSTGTFAAALYGSAAEELGGSVQSDNYAADKAWGAVFGAKRATEKAVTEDNASPWNPRNEIRN